MINMVREQSKSHGGFGQLRPSARSKERSHRGSETGVRVHLLLSGYHPSSAVEYWLIADGSSALGWPCWLRPERGGE
jgi:hypothetical protein